MNTDETKYKVLAALEAGFEPKQVAEDVGVSYATVIRWKREFETAKLNGDIDKLYNIDRIIIEQAAALAPVPSELTGQAKTVVKGLTGLQRLDESTQMTASAIDNKIRAILLSTESVSELEALTECLCKLRNAFFNQKSTQVQIQQNFGGQTTRETYGVTL